MSRTHPLLTHLPTEASEWDFDIAILGLGYVGLPTALAFDAAGARVLGIDIDEARLDSIRAGRADLIESDRARLSSANAGGGSWSLTSDASQLRRARAVIVCVPTPIDAHSVPELTALTSACHAVLEAVTPGQVILLTSTSYIGCTRALLVEPVRSRGLRPGIDVHIAFSPERINPADESFGHDEVPRVVGGLTDECAAQAALALHRYVETTHVVDTLEIAEATKLLENTFRAVNIAFINEFAAVCRQLEVPVTDVIDAAATKPYGFMPFRPGPGVGGHCIPCDPHYLLWQLRADRVQAPILERAMAGLAQRPHQVVSRVESLLADRGIAPALAHVAIVGVAYKPNVADVRESTAIHIIEQLRARGVRVSYIDSRVASIRLSDGERMQASDYLACEDADLVLLHTLHDTTDLEWLRQRTQLLDATYSLHARPGQSHI